MRGLSLPIAEDPLRLPASSRILEYKPPLSNIEIMVSCNVSEKGYTQYTYPLDLYKSCTLSGVQSSLLENRPG
jgi:hypothetical protein